MKLTKTKLIKRVKPGLIQMGYMWFKDSITGCDGLFIKQLPNNLYLSIGMIKHRFYDDKYTCDYYLSTTTCLNCIWGDIPEISSRRPGELLTDAEILPSCSHDIWWSGDNSVNQFLTTIKITEPRLKDDKALISRIKRSKDAQLLKTQAEKTIKVKDNIPNIEFKYKPNKPIDNINTNWFMAAEYVLSKTEKSINSHQVKRLAADAYRQYILSTHNQTLVIEDGNP